MTPETLDHLAALRDRLNSRLQDLQADIARASGLQPVRDSSGTSEVTDRKDDAARSQIFEVAKAEEQRDLEEAMQIDNALQRMKSGSYGTCEQCGSSIPLQRLLVQPAAERCLECQKALETEARHRSAS